MFSGNSKKDIQRLKESIDFSFKDDAIHPVEINESDDAAIKDIKNSFNTLGRKLAKSNEELKELTKLEAKNKKLEGALAEYKGSVDYLSVISELGQKITSALSLDKIFQHLYESLNSMADTPLVLLAVADQKKKTLKYLRYPDFRQPLAEDNSKTNTDETAAAKWTFENGQEVFLNDAEKDYARYFYHPLISTDGDKMLSVISVPMLMRGAPCGALLIASFRKDAYTDYILNMLRSLTTYLTVAIDNASIYDELRTTQAQLVQSEKMASLGQLTAGVAHEINNPINFVSAGIESLKSNYADIKEVLEAYMKLKPGEDNDAKLARIEKLKKELEIDGLLPEMDDLYKSVKNGAVRTTEIVRNLRNFTRLDENELKKANLEEGLDSTLVILNSQLKDRIEVIKEYGHIPPVACFPGQINQVFINILNNAAQAIQGPGKIIIKTAISGEYAEIRIKDSGKGMTEEVKNRIFDPFFTTKDVGIGTGLGLSISFGIIEKHKGQITVNSAPGQGAEFVIKIPLNLY